MEYGILGLIVLILDIIVIVKVMSSSATPGTKILWTLLIVLLPVVGLIAWWLAGPK